MNKEKKRAWLERVEALIHMLEGSSISELELTEGDTEITIHRKPGMVLTAAPVVAQTTAYPAVVGAERIVVQKPDQSISVNSPLTGVYYSSPSPAMPPFVSVGDVVHVGQVVALVEAMKVFNEVTADVSGRVVSLCAKNGEVVQKGEALLHIEPL